MHATSREYRGAEDDDLLRSFLLDARAGGNLAGWHPGDLVWRFFLHSLRHDLGETVRLWLDSRGRLRAFAIVTPRSRAGNLLFDGQAHPQAGGRALWDEMLSWIESLAGVAHPPPRVIATDVGVYDADEAQAAALGARGYRPTGDEALLLARSLQAPIPPPALPAGFRLRPVAGLQEAARRAEAHRDAFHPSRITAAAYERLMSTPGYDAQWDLVAEAPDGCLAAFCLVWLDAANGSGEFEPVGTRRAFRRLGLARAVLLEGLRRLAEAGAQTALVGPIDAGDDIALALYRSAGFRPAHHLRACARVWGAPGGPQGQARPS